MNENILCSFGFDDPNPHVVCTLYAFLRTHELYETVAIDLEF